MLTTGIFCRHQYQPTSWEESIFVSTNAFISYYKADDRNSERYRTIQSHVVIACIDKFCPSAIKARRKSGGTQGRGYDLPHIDVARGEFDKAMGGGVDWGWEVGEDTALGCPFTDDQLDAMREDYDLSDGSVGPDVNLVEA